MPNFKRCKITGGTYFFTVVLANRDKQLLVENFDLLSLSLNSVRKRFPFSLRGWVVLPDHLHCLWTLPEKDHDFPGRWWHIKNIFTRSYRQRHGNAKTPVWQNRFWEHTIRNQADFDHHLDYIHFNPVKHGYVTKSWCWEYSSFRYFVKNGKYGADWGHGDNTIRNNVFGE